MKTKFIITGIHSINKELIALNLSDKSAAMRVCKLFSSNPRYEENDDYIYLESSEVNNAYKNNAFLYITPDDENQYYGVTLEEFERNNIVTMELDLFNSLSQHVFEMYNVVVVWIDTSVKRFGILSKLDILETKYLMERLLFMKYLYFLNEEIDLITDTLLNFYFAKEEEREEIFKKNQ